MYRGRISCIIQTNNARGTSASQATQTGITPKTWCMLLEIVGATLQQQHASCVGVGDMQDDETAAESLLRWRPQSRQAGRQKRVVIKVSDALKPAAYVAHKGAPPASAGVSRVTMKDVFDGDGDRLVLWDVAHVCLAADWTAPPATQAPSANPNATAAYDDDADFFAAEAPCHVVGSLGKVLPPFYEEMDLDCLTPCLLVTARSSFRSGGFLLTMQTYPFRCFVF